MPEKVDGPESSTGRSAGHIGGGVSRAVRRLVLANQDAQHAVAHRLGLGLNDVTALEHLFNAPDGLGPADLAQRLGIRSASATALVDRLEQAGHVARAAHLSDRRRTVVTPTEHAREEAVAALRPLVGAIDEAAARLTEEEREVVLRFLTDATSRLSTATGEVLQE